MGTIPGDTKPGHVGVPIPCNIVKLTDVEELNYLAENGEGEVDSTQLIYCTRV